MARHDSAHARSPLDERCVRHQFEAAVDRCRQCGNPFCPECLVYAFGDRQPPFCIPCALAASGVRANARRPTPVPRKELKRRRQEADARRDAAASEPAADDAIDWSLPPDEQGRGPVTSEQYPEFDDEGRPARPQQPPPAKGDSGRRGLFGRRKKRVTPF